MNILKHFKLSKQGMRYCEKSFLVQTRKAELFYILAVFFAVVTM